MILEDEAATDACGRALARAWDGGPLRIHLHGPLGAGKTSLVRAMLRELGVTGTVRSPTYTLVEPYSTARGPVHHLDLYRIAGARELEALDLPSMDEGLLLVEWPERGAGALAAPDLVLALDHRSEGAGRELALEARSRAADRLAQALAPGGPGQA